MYGNLGESGLAAENIKKAYELKDRASELEQLHISAAYFQTVTGNLEKSMQTAQIARQTYPRDGIAANGLGVDYELLGETDNAIQQFSDAIRLNPKDTLDLGNLSYCYLTLDRLDEARATVERAPGGDKNPEFLRILYQVSFLHLGLARTYALEGEKDKARTACQDFLALWEHADPDVPILKQAKAEYAELK
jgi:eukaryotic-like serine/threonine-protein kinase